MKRIGLLSDTRFPAFPAFSFFEKTDEIWHAGDFGKHGNC